ncbi:CorA family divalent cation transporter [Paragemmobacter straminiformis]|uniref:Magnesium transporter CorA n=1 Tax=Paragemmobacter straminiformis TaxID=2045119 RepID=A0A842IAB0_9RHOB|nr:CorA family divalent cation transporter [Gemmobacter straminiformis]MBC2836531.1 magnesium transporter CorA [Gemmobacter straminiformis]
MSHEAITELLRKQRLVAGLSTAARKPGQEVVDSLVTRQQAVELGSQLGRMTPEAIAAVLEGLDLSDAMLVWQSLPATRTSDVAWFLPRPLREALDGRAEPRFGENRITVCERVNGRVRFRCITDTAELAGTNPVWIDLVGASAAERQLIGAHYGIDLHDPGEETDLEVSSRFQVDDAGSVWLHSNFLLDRNGASRSVPVAFALTGQMLFSLRNEELPVFRLLRRRLSTMPVSSQQDCVDIMIALYGADVEYSADSLEDIYRTLGKAGRHVLSEKMTDQEAASVLADIAEEEDLNGRIRSNIMDSQRAISFLMQARNLQKTQIASAKQVLRNIDSLNSHTAFLFDKINFLMDATIGFININQNTRVSQLTVFGLVFMPINILSGMGGMSEFSMMTRAIPWPVAYGGFMVGCIFVGWFTYLFIRRAEMRRIRQSRAKSGAMRHDS